VDIAVKHCQRQASAIEAGAQLVVAQSFAVKGNVENRPREKIPFRQSLGECVDEARGFPQRIFSPTRQRLRNLKNDRIRQIQILTLRLVMLEFVAGFLEKYRNRTLGDVFGDNSWVSIYDKSLHWLNLPPQDFLDYAEKKPRFPFDGVPEDPNLFRGHPTFLILQAHRVWLTIEKIRAHFLGSSDKVMLDLGAYPFTVDLAARNYLNFDCRIISTINQRMQPDWQEPLRQNRIETVPANLDPLVRPTTPIDGMTDEIPLGENTVDFVVFSHVIEHLYHPYSIIREAYRVLKPGGRILISTDNAFLIGGFLNYLTNGAFLHEPVQMTAAMVFTEWRGHVRFYSDADLRTLVETAGFNVLESGFYEVLYNSVLEKYFVDPFVRIPQWRVDLLTENPELRNEVILVAEKR
jgi:SAM-dependent methyltransferase